MKNLFLTLLLFAASTLEVRAQIALEHTYQNQRVNVFKHGNTVEYHYVDQLAHQMTIYDSAHALLRTISIPIPSNATLGSEPIPPTSNLFSTTGYTEYVFDYVSYDSSGQYYTYSSIVVDEFGNIVIDLANRRILNLYDDSGTAKMLVRYSDNSQSVDIYWTEIYSLPGIYVNTIRPTEVFPETGIAYPNPSNERVTLPYKLPAGKVGTMNVLDLNGSIILQKSIGSAFEDITIDVSNLASGIYCYYTESNGSISNKNKFVVTK